LNVVEAMAADADELGLTPGTMLRQWLERRYSALPNVRKSNGNARNRHTDTDVVELPE
jgi:hypothetical protein